MFLKEASEGRALRCPKINNWETIPSFLASPGGNHKNGCDQTSGKPVTVFPVPKSMNKTVNTRRDRCGSWQKPELWQRRAKFLPNTRQPSRECSMLKRIKKAQPQKPLTAQHPPLTLKGRGRGFSHHSLYSQFWDYLSLQSFTHWPSPWCHLLPFTVISSSYKYG